MENNEKKEKVKSELEIKKELISKDLTALMKYFITFLLLAGIFGFIGYKYCVDNNESILKGIVYGSLFPFGLILVNERYYGSLFSYILYIIIYFLLADIFPIFIGTTILFYIFVIYIVKFIEIKTKDRTREIREIKTNIEIDKEIKRLNLDKKENNTLDISSINNKKVKKDNKKYIKKDFYNDDFKEEFECEICFKKISEEEYEAFDGMCEDCFYDVHTDFDGNFHDDEFFG